MEELIYKDEVYKIVGCAMEAHKELGFGFLESVYEEALRYEFNKSSVPYQEQKLLEIKYKDIILEKKFLADFVCFDKIIVELKATDKLTDEHYSQVLNYLNATKYKLGLLINFGSKSLEYKRVALTKTFLV
jgi:GxxExxY protein